jgi:hypothetical protein
MWCLVTTIILLNVLISLFASAYEDVGASYTPARLPPVDNGLQIVDNAEAQYLAFFAAKTVAMIRAPDSYARNIDDPCHCV